MGRARAPNMRALEPYVTTFVLQRLPNDEVHFHTYTGHVRATYPSFVSPHQTVLISESYSKTRSSRCNAHDFVLTVMTRS